MKEKLKPLILKPGLMNRVFHQFGNFQAPMPKRFLPQKPKSTFCTLSKEEKTFQRISNHSKKFQLTTKIKLPSHMLMLMKNQMLKSQSS